MLPDGWDAVVLGEHSVISRGGSPRPIQDYLTSNCHGINWIKIGDVSKDSKYISSTAEKILREGATKSRAVFCGDLVLSNSMSFGRPYILKIDGCIHDGWLVIQNYQSAFDKEYLYYCLGSEFTIQQYISMAAGSSVQNLNKDKVSAVIIAKPPIQEQTAISEALSDVDSLISSLQKLIEKKKAIKQGAMQELLTGKKRLPGFCREWDKKCLCDLAKDITTGTKNNEDKVQNGKYPFFVRSACVEKINSHSYDCEAILVPGEGNIGEIFHYINGKFDLHQRVYKISEFQECVGLYIFYYMKRFFGPYALLNTVKATVDSLRLPAFLKFKIFLSNDLTEQQAIAQVLSDMDSEIEQLEKKLAKYQQIKQGMMQELLTGRIRLVDVENNKQPKTQVLQEKQPQPAHNQHFDDAVMIAGIVNAFYSEKYPLGRKKVQKLLYLVRRKERANISAFHKKAAGPYADKVRYKGGEPIAQRNGYIQIKNSDKGSYFKKGIQIQQALTYLQDWGKQADVDWLVAQFQYTGVDELELWATVDMAICDLRREGKEISVASIKDLIQSNKEWKDKLKKTYFSDTDIEQAIKRCRELFPNKEG